MARASGVEAGDALVRLGYATGDEVMRTDGPRARSGLRRSERGQDPAGVMELVPESVARENAILPLAEEDGR